MSDRKRNREPGFSRRYRKASPQPGECSFQVVAEQSDLWITVRSGCGAGLEALALQTVVALRAQLKAWMLLDPMFCESLSPLFVPETAPEIIRRMCAATAIMDVGPMAAVAGGIAGLTARVLACRSADCMVENGGDSMLYSTRERVVGLLPDPRRRAMLGLRLGAGAFPVSLCASSSFIGHSLSFGQGDLAVVRAKDPFLADAAATALCNMLRDPKDVQRAADRAASLASEGLQGVFLQCGGKIGIWGDMELTAL